MCSKSLHQTHGFLLDSLQYVHVSLVLRSPDEDPLFQVWPHLFWVERSCPTDNTLLDTAQDSISLLCCTNILLAYSQLCVNQDPKVVFCTTTFQTGGPQLIWCLGLFLHRWMALLFPLLNSLRLAPVSPCLHWRTVKIPLDGSTMLWHISRCVS